MKPHKLYANAKKEYPTNFDEDKLTIYLNKNELTLACIAKKLDSLETQE